MPPILQCWPETPEADGGMAVEAESSHQYSVTFCWCETNSSRGQSGRMMSDMEVRMKQNCVWIHSWKKWHLQHSLILAEYLWRPNMVEWTREQWGDAVTVTWKTSHVIAGLAQHPHKLADYYQVNGYGAEMHWKWWSQCWNITKLEPGGSHECSHGNRKNTACKFVRTYWTNMRLKVAVSCITSLLVMRDGVTCTSWSQNSSPWNDKMWIPSPKTKLKTQFVSR